MSDTLHAAMGAALVQAGLASPEDVAADTARIEAERADPAAPSALGLQAAQPDPTKPEVPLDPIEAAALAAFAPAPHAGAYQFERLPHGLQGDIQQEADLRGILHSEGVPQSIGTLLGNTWNKFAAAQAVAPQSAAQIELGALKCREVLARSWGPENLKGNLAAVQEVANRMAAKDPRIGAALSAGLGNDPHLILSLHNWLSSRGAR